ncbi:MAG: LptF/LptG family permease [Pseudomonadaceae bacterium]|nr:LptF/LptG family permease [Pseudomonadaceae bacterium]
MHTLPRYLFRTALFPTVAAMVIMLSLVWLLQSLRFLDFVINKGLGLATFLQLTGLLVPSLLTVILPLAVFAGVAYSFKYLADESELTALFATGWSRIWTLTPALLFALLMVAAGYGLHMALLPTSTTAFKNLQYNIRSGQSDLLLEPGTFNQLGNGLMVYVGKRTGPTAFNTLLVHDTRDPSASTTWTAESGQLTLQNGSPRLILNNGQQQKVTATRVETLSFTANNLDLTSSLTPLEIAPRTPELEEYGFAALWHGTGATTPKRKQEMRAEAVRRLLWPLAPLPLVIWAGGWLLRVPGRQSGTLKSLAIASAGAIAYVALMMGLRGAAESNTAILYAQWLLPLAFITFGIVQLRGIRHG